MNVMPEYFLLFPVKYINMLHNIKIVKGLHKECVYCRKNGIRKITNAKCDECDISMCQEMPFILP